MKSVVLAFDSRSVPLSRSAAQRIPAFDYLRVFIIFLVVLHHAVMAYCTGGHAARGGDYTTATAPVVDPVSGQACVFDVYFAKSSHWYPMKWERRLVTGNIVTSYAVEELGFIKMENGENIPYPKISVLKHYQDGKLRDTERLEVQQISFDTVRDADVSIDPASVRLIRDLDSGAKIQVAK